MAIEVGKRTAPAHWASYLINGDASGFEYSNTPDDKAGDRDQAQCDAWTERLAKDGWRVISTEDEAEPTFTHSNDAGTLAGDVLTYILHREHEPESGYTHCACRDCFETVVSDDMRHPDMCDECEESGCEPDSECQRSDAYGVDDAIDTSDET